MFLSGLWFILIVVISVVALVWFLYKIENNNRTQTSYAKEQDSGYTNFLRTQQKEKEKASVIKGEFDAVSQTLFYNEMCYQAWKVPLKLVGDIYKKYEDEFEWKEITPLELIILMDNGFAEAGGDEVVIFNREKTGVCKTPINKPNIPRKCDDAVRKSTVPLSEYYFGPYSEYKKYEMYGYKINAYLAVVIVSKVKLDEARKQLSYRRKLEGEELDRYNNISLSYKKYKDARLYD